jgi:hypothetical protein
VSAPTRGPGEAAVVADLPSALLVLAALLTTLDAA